jgi:hypothetical protein
MDIHATTGVITLERQTRFSRFLMMLISSFLMLFVLGASQALAADTISSAANQVFAVNQANEVISTITITNVDNDMTNAN